jgi:hypothetical protein
VEICDISIEFLVCLFFIDPFENAPVGPQPDAEIAVWRHCLAQAGMAAAAPWILPVCADTSVAMARRMGKESCIVVEFALGTSDRLFFDASLGVALGVSLGVSFGVSFDKK